MVWGTAPLPYREGGMFLTSKILPCKSLAPIVEEISNEMTDVEFGVLDIDSQPNSPIRPEFSVRGIPSCFIVKGGSVVGSKVGLTNKQDFVNWIKGSI